MKLIFRIKRRLVLIYNYFRYIKTYSEKYFLIKQQENFKKKKLSRSQGLLILNQLKKKYPQLNSSMTSEHSLIFCSLKHSKKKIKNILEIGTYDGANSLLLSILFPNSIIDTYDLKKTESSFQNIYGRNNKKSLREFIQTRTKNLKKLKNVNFIEKNSISLIEYNKNKYDLIWIDGAHNFPTIAIDIANSLRLVNKNGIILCDDIIIEAREYDQYNAKDSLITLNEFELAKMLNFKLFYKRISKEFNAVPKERKYIAFIEKFNP